ncbi:hypothetical protein FRC12_007294 [Ceratobasidium sp. 428]|nr:hypothetical protein FRC12_007294 [Ceratobasidium sp. 428]
MQGIDHLTQSIATTSRIESTIESVKADSHRWRSLDIAFCDMRRITQILEFLGRRSSGTLHLESLTIGPMGSTTLNSHEFFGEAPIGGDAAAFPDITAAESSFEKLNVSCDALRIDTYPIATSSGLFSSRLTVLEAFVGGYGGYDIDFGQWERILLQTRNLIHLRLKNFKCSHRILIRSTRVDVFELPILERLELSGEFAWFIEYLGDVSFPKLESLTLNSFGMPQVVNNALVSIVSVSPLIRRLSICTGNNNWDTVLRGLHLLQEVTFSEMRWDNVIIAFTWLVELPGLLHVRLEHIWDMDMADPRFEALYPRLPPIELVDCFAGGRSDCRCSSDCETCASEDQSNYSDNSSFSGTSHSSEVFPPSEETSSDESERSYGEDENLGFAGPVRNWDV